MKYKMVVDKREKFPLPIPKRIVCLGEGFGAQAKRTVTHEIEVVSKTLPVGDYGIWSGHNAYHIEGACVVERKASASELANNVFDGRARANFVRELEEMRANWRHPYLLFEGNAAALYKKVPSIDFGILVDGVQRLMLQYGIPFLFIPGGSASARGKAADFVTRLLINGANAK